MDNGEEWDSEVLRRRKAVKKTTKALNTLCDNIGEALARSAWQGKLLEDAIDQARTRKMEAEQKLATHVAKIRELVTYYYQQQQDILTNSVRHFLQQVMVCKTEGLNFEARLTDLERQAREKLCVITEQDDVTKSDRNDVTALSQGFKTCAVPSLAPEVVESVNCTLEVPDGVADCVQTLVGHLVTSSPDNTTTSASSSFPGHAGSDHKTTEPAGARLPSPNDRQGQAGHKAGPTSSKKTKENKKKAKKEPETKKTQTNANPRPVPKPRSSSSPQQNIPQSPPSSKVGDKSKPTVLVGRGKAASSLAARADGKVWVVYGSTDPHLDLLDRAGTIVQSAIIPGGNAKHVASHGPADALVVSLAPRLMTLFKNGSDADSEVIEALNYKCTGLAVGRSGTALSGSCTIYWTSRHGGNSQWIVEEDDSCLKSVSSLAVLEAHGKVFVCAADKGGQAVHFYRMSLRGRFVPLDPYRPAEKRPFSPVSVSGHGAGFVAVLDGPSRRVHIVEVGKEGVTSLTTIDGYRLCDGVPSVLAFATADEVTTARPVLWVATTAGHVCRTRLSFDFNLL